MSAEPKLKPCPFCGSEDVEIRKGYDNEKLTHYASCNNCEADGPWWDDKYGSKWNAAIRKNEVRELLRLVDKANRSRHEIGRHQEAEAYDNGKEAWAVFDDGDSIVSVDLDSPEDAWRMACNASDADQATLERHNYTCRKVRVVEAIQERNRMTTQRKQLADEILQTDGRKPMRTLKPYAIGRWVSVEERLPERRGFYSIKWNDNYSHPDFTHSWFDPAPYDKINYWFSVRSLHHITHWLELDLPEEME